MKNRYDILCGVKGKQLVMHPISFTGYTRGQQLTEVSFYTLGGQKIFIDLLQPLALFAGRYSAYSLCRLCVSRMSLRNLEKVLLTMILDETECGLLYGRSYLELGKLVGKCAHSVETAIAGLRDAGLVVTSRVGRERAVVALSCETFVRWAESLLSDPPPEQVVTPILSRAETLPAPPPKKERKSKPAKSARKRPSDASVVREGVSVSPPAADAPVAESAPLPAVPVSSAPVPQKTDVPSGQKNYLTLSVSELQELPEAELAIYFEQYRKAQIALYTREDGTLYPGTYFNEDGMPQFDTASGYPCPPFLLPSTEDEDPVDPSQEIAESIAAQGGVNDTSSDELSFGAEIVETDFNPNVHVNPDI